MEEEIAALKQKTAPLKANNSGLSGWDKNPYFVVLSLLVEPEEEKAKLLIRTLRPSRAERGAPLRGYKRKRLPTAACIKWWKPANNCLTL